MRKLFLVLITAIFIIPVNQSLYAQELSKKAFKQLFSEGSLIMMENYYDTAVNNFLKIHQFDSTNANVSYKIGVCYLNIPGKKTQAIPYLESALRNSKGHYIEDGPEERNAPETILMNLGQAYQSTYKFDEALSAYEKFRGMVGKWNIGLVKDLDRMIETTNTAKELYSTPVDCKIYNLGDSINSSYPDYAPVLSADESMLVFTSRRPNLLYNNKDFKTIDGQYYEDVWISYPGTYGTWRKARPMSKEINSENNDAVTGISADGQQLYIYRNTKNGGDIYQSILDGNFWSEPKLLDALQPNGKTWQPSACISADGKTIYFASNRVGGYGGRDLYQCQLQPNGTWGKPENLGSTINTSYDEDAPFIHPDGITLFFSSTGHNTMGGFDVFHSTKVARNVWSKPINIGYPINTTEDDIYFCTSSDGRRAYYSSLRPEGKGEKDIYMISFAKPITQSVAILIGYLKNKEGGSIPEDAAVTITDERGETVTCKANTVSGKFIQSLMPSSTYQISIAANHKTVFTDHFYLPQDSSYQILSRGFFQKSIILGDTTSVFASEQKADTAKPTFTTMEGKILSGYSTQDFAPNVSIMLLNTFGNTIQTTTTDNNGHFKFENLPASQYYIIKVDENDPISKKKPTLFLVNKEGKVIATSEKEAGALIFKNLPVELTKINQAAIIKKQEIFNKTEGQVSYTKDGKTPASNINIKLKDEKGGEIQSKKTDETGHFVFENVPEGKNYSLELKNENGVFDKRESLYLLNQKGQVIQESKNINDAFVFRNLPPDLATVTPIYEADVSSLTSSKINKESIKNTVSESSDDRKYDFYLYFPYNKKEVDHNTPEFTSIVNKIKNKIKSNNKVTIVIEASSSHVPTEAYKDNQTLAEARGKELEEKLKNALDEKTILKKIITFKLSAKVQGKDYENDATINRKEYEKWQFLKVIIQ